MIVSCSHFACVNVIKLNCESLIKDFLILVQGVIVGSITGTCRFYDISSKPLFIVFITAFVYNAKEIAISMHSFQHAYGG